MFKKVGLECEMKLVGSSTKVLSFRKLLQSEKSNMSEGAAPVGEPAAENTAGEQAAAALGTVPAS